AQGVHILANGQILIGGTANPANNATRNFALARMNINGSLDTTFDLDGKILTDLPNATTETVFDMKVQGDGKIILAGTNGFDNALVRYNPNGTLDSSFDGDGLVTTSVDSLMDSANEIAFQSDGKIVVVSINTVGSPDFVLLRYHANGTLDASFGTNGILVSDMTNGSSDTSNAVAIQPDGRIVVAGRTRNTSAGSTDNFCVARHLPGNATAFDLDGDGKTDVSIFRPALGQWWHNRSSDGGNRALVFGVSTDTIVPADYTGDGKSDIAFFRPSTGFWYVLRSEDLSFFATPFGASGDVPVPTDFDADGKADIAVFRPSNSTWFINNSGGSPTTIQQFGIAGDVPVAADYDGDAKSDIAIYRPNAVGGAQWWIQRSATSIVAALQFGTSTDKTVVGDFTGDGKADIAFWRPSTGFWNVLRSEDLSYFAFPFGTTGDVPVAGDYDGDGKTDAGVFRPSNSTWNIQRSTAGTLIQQFGIAGDVPLPSVFVR
ncbi:MAG: FG-GAP-like repeat-containing protein, partial [Dokdonella sp.]